MTTTTDHSDTDVATDRPALSAPYGHFEGVPQETGAVQCLCPFCGNFHSGVGRACSKCSLEDTDATRTATEKRLGNWFILQANNPAAPGINLETLKRLIQRNIVTGRSVVRGPSTGQLWRLASKVRGLSREFGQCYSCGKDILKSDNRCAHCDRPQTLPEDMIEELEPRFRQPPREDRLTPRDVAKAFQLDFGSTDVAALIGRIPSRGVGKKMRIVIAAGVILAVGALAWPITSAIAGRSTPPVQNMAVGSPSTPAAVADTSTIKPAEDANLIASTDSVVPPKPVDVPVPPMIASAVLPPTPAAKTADSIIVPPAPILPATPIADVARHASPPPVAMVTPTAAANTAVTIDNDNPATLFSAGLDAESRGDYAAAVKVYEQIETLPGNEWPANLKTRLTLARAGLKGDLR